MKNIFRLGKLIDRIFEIGILAKVFFGFFEILGGILLSFSGKLLTYNFIIYMTREEIAEDSNDVIANYLINLANNFSLSAHTFATVYLFFHGAVNIFLAVFLMKNKLWAYPSAVILFGGFNIYQIYRYFHTFSPGLLLLTAFDVFVLFIIWAEYRRKKRKLI